MGVARPFFPRRPPAPLSGDVDTRHAAIFSKPLEGVGPQVSKILRLALDSKGYPRGDMLAFLRSAPLRDALELERVSHRARWEVKEVEKVTLADIEARRNKPKGGGRG